MATKQDTRLDGIMKVLGGLVESVGRLNERITALEGRTAATAATATARATTKVVNRGDVVELFVKAFTMTSDYRHINYIMENGSGLSLERALETRPAKGETFTDREDKRHKVMDRSGIDPLLTTFAKVLNLKDIGVTRHEDLLRKLRMVCVVSPNEFDIASMPTEPQIEEMLRIQDEWIAKIDVAPEWPKLRKQMRTMNIRMSVPGKAVKWLTMFVEVDEPSVEAVREAITKIIQDNIERCDCSDGFEMCCKGAGVS